MRSHKLPHPRSLGETAPDNGGVSIRRGRCGPAARWVAVPALLLSAAGGLLQAQFDAHRGRIVGVVMGPDGGVIPAAAVELKSIDSGISRTVRSDSLGRFQAGTLNPGQYSATASSPDFASAEVTGITVNVGSTVHVDIHMALEQLHSEIEVTAALVDTMLPASDNIVESDVFAKLPINGRRFHDFALLTPSVQVTRAAGHLSFGAQRGIYTNVTVDGTDYNQAFFGGIQGGERAGSIITVPQSAVQEFQAITSGFTAEYGRTTSGVVNVSTKSGSNEFHGDAFYQIRHPDLGIADPFGAKVLEKLQQFGGSAGGPLARNRSFWFFAIERQNADTPRYVEFPLLDAASRESGAEAYDYFQSLEQSFQSTNDAWALTPRFDFQLGDSNQLMTRYNFSTAKAVNSVSIGDPRLPRTTNALSHNGTEEDSIHFATVQWTSLLTPNIVNQLRFTATREQRPRNPNEMQPAVLTTLGDFGSRTFLPTTETDFRPLINNSLMIHSGAHDFKFGVEGDRIWIDDIFGYNQFGTFVLFSSDPDEILDALTPGGAIANRFDAPGQYFRQIGNTVGVQQLGHAALYLQDSWRPFHGLTLDLGFRWAAQINQDPLLGNDALIARVRGVDFPLGAFEPDRIPDDKRQWMPRLGFAYSPNGGSQRTVFRGSVGVFHAVTPPVFLNAATKVYRQPPFNLSVKLPTAGSTVYRQFLDAGIDLNAYPLDSLPVFQPDEVIRVLGEDPLQGAAPRGASPDFRNPRAVKFTLGMESRLTDKMVAGVQWMYNRTTRLHGMRDYNLPRSSVRPDDPAGIPYYDLSQRPEPSLSTVWVTESLGRASYNGVTANWKYLGDSMRFIAHYTYARAYSSDINEGYFWEPLYTDHARPEDAYGPADLDLRHQVTAHALIDLPGNFTWSAIVRTASAPPLNPTAGMDLNGDFYTADRALMAPGRYFGRNAFRNRGMRNIDMRLLRRFSFSERISAQFSAEVFNIFDFDNVEYGRFNRLYGPGLDLETGAPIGPSSSWRKLRAEDGGYDRNNTQIPGVGPLQVQIGLRFFF